jgi:hypothetical protein
LRLSAYTTLAIAATVAAAFFAWSCRDARDESDSVESEAQEVIADAAVQLAMTKYLQPRPILSYRLTGKCSATKTEVAAGIYTNRNWSVECPTEEGPIGFSVFITTEPDNELESLASVLLFQTGASGQFREAYDDEWQAWACGYSLVDQGREALVESLVAGSGPCAFLEKSHLARLARSFGLPPPEGY